MGCFDILYVPKSLESFWGGEAENAKWKVERWKVENALFSDFAPGRIGVRKHMILARFVTVLGYLGTLYIPKTFGMAKNA